ncbi:hypothetical protein DSO57_1000315 [Entomophthora muscae]|uniref:Uncharacterized protein n=1 Tax=Entomophthora muscae TaxID=34485 RepID=A0ACC2TKK6_9FUNG|nr:hypothetical protein DSO57_1000315 [Entomophthora muscae]
MGAADWLWVGAWDPGSKQVGKQVAGSGLAGDWLGTGRLAEGAGGRGWRLRGCGRHLCKFTATSGFGPLNLSPLYQERSQNARQTPPFVE